MHKVYLAESGFRVFVKVNWLTSSHFIAFLSLSFYCFRGRQASSGMGNWFTSKAIYLFKGWLTYIKFFVINFCNNSTIQGGKGAVSKHLLTETTRDEESRQLNSQWKKTCLSNFITKYADQSLDKKNLDDNWKKQKQNKKIGCEALSNCFPGSYDCLHCHLEHSLLCRIWPGWWSGWWGSTKRLIQSFYQVWLFRFDVKSRGLFAV